MTPITPPGFAEMVIGPVGDEGHQDNAGQGWGRWGPTLTFVLVHTQAGDILRGCSLVVRVCSHSLHLTEKQSL